MERILLGERSFRSGSKDPIIPYSIVVRLFVFQKREGKGEKKLKPFGIGFNRSVEEDEGRRDEEIIEERIWRSEILSR